MVGYEISLSYKFRRSCRHFLSVQLSNQNDMSLPSATFQIIPCRINSLHFIILLHTIESSCLILLWKKSCCYTYFPCIIWTHILSLLVRIFHASLHWNAVLTATVLRRPIPPLSLGLHIRSHATRGIPLSVLFFFQKNSLFNRSICVVITFSSWKH